MQRRAGHDRETTASSGGSPLARLATCLVLPREGDAFETSVRPPCGERMQRAACVQIPGSDTPFALALPEQRFDLGGSCALKHCSDQLPDRRGQTRRQSPRHTRRLIDPGLLDAPKGGKRSLR
jgi:hypothetical protein